MSKIKKNILKWRFFLISHFFVFVLFLFCFSKFPPITTMLTFEQLNDGDDREPTHMMFFALGQMLYSLPVICDQPDAIGCIPKNLPFENGEHAHSKSINRVDALPMTKNMPADCGKDNYMFYMCPGFWCFPLPCLCYTSKCFKNRLVDERCQYVGKWALP